MMKFEGETLIIGGREYTGSVVIETEVSDASFDHAFGTEKVIDIKHYPVCFYTGDGMQDGIDAGPALDRWLTSNRSRVEKRFDLECKRSL